MSEVNEVKAEAPTTVSAAPAVGISEPKVPEVAAVEANDDIFITENDTFDATIRYYKKDGDLKVEKVDDDFDVNASNIKTITFTCKHPSQGDYQAMLNSGVYKDLHENITGIDLTKLEMTRLSLLMRSWTVPKPINELINSDPKIVKAMLVCVNDKIGLKAIF